MIHPHLATSEYRYPVAVRYSPPPVMARRIPHISIPSSLAIMNIYTMNDNVGHILYSDAWTSSNVHISSSSVDCFERVHDQFFLEPDHHVTSESDP